MTWMVGTPTAFGYAIGISDIRVTWEDGRILDCLQKVYPVGEDVAAGFAGSVRLGFELIDDLRTYLRLDDPSRVWIPRAVALKWDRRARRRFSEAADVDRKLGARVMLLGVSHRVNIGLPEIPLVTVAIMRSPEFVPHFLPIATVDSIGSGSSHTAYADMLRHVSMEYGLWELELRIPGAYAKAVRHVIQQTIEKNPGLDVSPHVHLCTVRRGAIEITTSDHNSTWSSGEVVEWRMPPVATTWSEFNTLTRQAFGSSAEAVAATA